MADDDRIDYTKIEEVITKNYNTYKRENYNNIIEELKKYPVKYDFKSFYIKYKEINYGKGKDESLPPFPNTNEIKFVKKIIEFCYEVFNSIPEESYKYYIICYVIYWLYFVIINKYKEGEKEKEEGEKEEGEKEVYKYIYYNFKDILVSFSTKNKNSYILLAQIYQISDILLNKNCNNYHYGKNICTFNVPYIFIPLLLDKEIDNDIFKKILEISSFNIENQYIIDKLFIKDYNKLDQIYIDNNKDKDNKDKVFLDANVKPPGNYDKDLKIYIDFRILQD